MTFFLFRLHNILRHSEPFLSLQTCLTTLKQTPSTKILSPTHDFLVLPSPALSNLPSNVQHIAGSNPPFATTSSTRKKQSTRSSIVVVVVVVSNIPPFSPPHYRAARISNWHQSTLLPPSRRFLGMRPQAIVIAACHQSFELGFPFLKVRFPLPYGSVGLLMPFPLSVENFRWSICENGSSL